MNISWHFDIPGGKGSGFRNVTSEEADVEEGDSRVFRVQCVRGEMDARATQVSANIENIRSDDVFILSTTTEVLVWKGSASNTEEAVEGERLAGKLYPDLALTVVEEGEEPTQFWNIIGAEPGSEIAASDLVTGPMLSPRLFHVTAKRAFEISNFKREDLVGDDVMLLDSGDEVYLWVGEDSEAEEASRGLDLAKQYLDADPTPR